MNDLQEMADAILYINSILRNDAHHSRIKNALDQLEEIMPTALNHATEPENY